MRAPLVHFKSLETEDGVGDPEATGVFEAVVSVFGNADRVGEKVLPGAFEQSLVEWEASGDPIPVIWSHMWDNPFAHLGKVLQAEELKAGDERLPEPIRNLGGLFVKGEIDLTNDFAKQVHKGMKARTIKEFSFSYRVTEETKEDDGSRGLKSLSIIEVGPCLKGVNPSTQLLAAKAQLEDSLQDDLFDQTDEVLIKSAVDALEKVLTSLDAKAEDVFSDVAMAQLEADLLQVLL